MMGFVLPLYLIIGFQAILGVNLMLPLPLCMPAVKFCRFCKHNTVARTVINTAAGFLMVLMLAPAYDAWMLSRAKKLATHVTADALSDTTTEEATSQLSACLTGASIGNLFMLRHLGATIDERENLKAQLLAANMQPDIGVPPKADGPVDIPLKAE